MSHRARALKLIIEHLMAMRNSDDVVAVEVRKLVDRLQDEIADEIATFKRLEEQNRKA